MDRKPKDYGLFVPRRNRHHRLVIHWPLDYMKPGDSFTVDPRDRSWGQVRASMYNEATKLGRAGCYKISPRPKTNAQRHQHIRVTCVADRDGIKASKSDKVMELYEKRRAEQEAAIADVRAMLD